MKEPYSLQYMEYFNSRQDPGESEEGGTEEQDEQPLSPYKLHKNVYSNPFSEGLPMPVQNNMMIHEPSRNNLPRKSPYKFLGGNSGVENLLSMENFSLM